MIEAPAIEMGVDVSGDRRCPFADTGFSVSAAKGLGVGVWILFLVPIICDLPGREKAVVVVSRQFYFILVDFIFERDVKRRRRRLFGAEMQYLVGAAGTHDVVPQAAGLQDLQKRKRLEEIRLPRSVGADQDIDRAELKLLKGRDALETLDRNPVQRGHGAIPETPSSLRRPDG